MPTLEINGQNVEVDDGFLKLSPDQQNATVDEIAKSLPKSKPAGSSVGHHAANIGLSALQGATFGFSDEIGAGIKSILSGKPYSEELKAQQERLAEIPTGERIGGEIAGALATAPLTAGLGMAGEGAGLLARAARFAALGGAEGAASGAGHADPGQRLQGAEAGAVAGGLTGLAVPGAVSGVTRAASAVRGLSPANRATQKLATALARDQITPERAAARLDTLGPEATLADVGGPNVLGRARAAAATPGEAQNLITRTLENRQLGQSDRLTNTVDQTLSDKNLHDTVDNIIQARSSAVAPLYDQARSAGSISSPALDRLIQKSGHLRAAIREAKRLPDLADLPDNDMRVLDQAYKSLGGQARAINRSGDNVAAFNRTNLQNQLRDAITDQVPVYGQALKEFSGPAEVLDAVQLGRKALNLDSEVTAKQLSGMSQSAKEGFAIGVARALKDKIDATPDSANAVRRIFGNKALQQKLQAAFPDQASFRQFKQQALREAIFNSTRNAVLQGSRTTPLAMEVADLGPVPKGLAGFLRSGTNGGKWGIISHALDRVHSALTEPSDEMKRQLGQLLMSKDLQGNKALLQEIAKTRASGQITRPLQALLAASMGNEAGALVAP